MEIVETKFYTKYITELLSDEEYQELQNYLMENPKSGDIIKASGGIRKLRWKLKNKGKSSGIRNIYYFYENKDTLLMLFAYEKGRKDNLSDKELSILREAIKGF